MKKEIDFKNKRSIFILGAGASIDYGLPAWKKLDSLIRERINNDIEKAYFYGKDIINWMNKVGKEYSTIDECIKEESVKGDYHSNGDEVEKEVFQIMKDSFNQLYQENNTGWIHKLNDKILNNPTLAIEKKMAFISYNYDMVLEKNFLDFEYLPGKHKRLNSKQRLNELVDAEVTVLYPHGNLYSELEWKPKSSLNRISATMKTDVEGYTMDAVSCHESYEYSISHWGSGSGSKIKLYILGLGGGLKLNLSKLSFDTEVSEIHITIKDPDIKKEIITFLEHKFGLETSQIFIYNNCQELIEQCF